MKELYTALAEFNKEMPTLTPDEKGFRNSFYSYHTAMQRLRPLLSKHGLSVTGGPTLIEGKNAYKTLLVHVSGESIECVSYIEGKNRDELKTNEGSIRRRHIFGLLCLTNYNDDIEDIEYANNFTATNKRPDVVNQDVYVSLKQIQRISTLIGTDVKLAEKIKQKLNIKTLDQIPADKYGSIIEYLQSIKGKK